VKKFEDDVIVSGLGQSAVGRCLDRSPLALTLDAIGAAVADAGLTPGDISGLAAYPGGGSSIGAAFAGPPLADVYDALGLRLDYFMGSYEGPAQLSPVLNASLAISAGLARHVVVYRTVTEGSARQAARAAGHRPAAGPSPWITAFGEGPAPVGYALLARRHFHEFGTSREQLAQIALTARKHAALNPAAVLREPLTMDAYLSGRMISDPLSLYDCDVHCDGSTAIVLSAADYAADAPQPPVRVEAFGLAPPVRAQYAQHAELQPGRQAASQLWNRTDLRPADVDVAALYDGFSILTMLWLEALGFCRPGESGAFVEGGQRIGLGGELPLNTNGGQLSGGRLHGLGFVHEACLQLRGQAGARQAITRQAITRQGASGQGASGQGSPARVALVAVGALPYVGCLLLRAGDR
jgi:acetyl-CoA acetyltransferase